MHLPRSTLAQAALVAALTGAFYARGLDVSPPHLTHDEIKFALQAHAVAETGRDINGRLFPVYFIEPGFSVGRDPLCIYVTAAVLSVLPLSETSIRFATVLVGAAAVALLYVLALELFASPVLAAIVAGVMALSPTFYIHSRLALSVLYPVPFTILWLIVLHRYLSAGTRRAAYATGVVLGAGIYSYLAAAIMMPLYLAMTVLVMVVKRDRRGAVAVTIAFAVMLIPIAAWQVVEPDRYRNIISAYRLFDTQPGIEDRPTPASVGRGIIGRVDTYWDSFNPGRLFFTGESSVQISTREVGSLLTPVAVLLVAGLWSLRQRSDDVMPRWVWIVGLVSAPLPAVIMADVEIRRWLVVVPFAAIVAGFGADRFVRGGTRGRVVLAMLIALMIVQFASFSRDYFGPYRDRSTVWFGGNIRAALTTVLEEARAHPPSVVYISNDIPWVDAYWRFYSTVDGQGGLLARTQYVRLSAGELPVASSGAVLVGPAPTAMLEEQLASAGWREPQVVLDFGGRPSLMLTRARR
jgi:4-amino-4-deoxy-L-arabinose transferase-like glycosyltransferase